jgi:GMP synthase-like glutamine amidotransferase
MQTLVFQHVSVEHPGVFRDFWLERGDQWHVVELDAGEAIPDPSDFDLLLVMGGPMDVWQEDAYPWLAPEKASIRHWVRHLHRPFLGICLGHQLLAASLGGKVGLMTQPEIGLGDVELTDAGRQDSLFAGFGRLTQTFQWHGAEVSKLPDGAEILAANSACPVQAFRWGQHAYGLQYHVEITASTVGEWNAIPEYRAGLERTLGTDGASRLDEAVSRELPRLKASARCLHDNVVKIVAAAQQMRRGAA